MNSSNNHRCSLPWWDAFIKDQKQEILKRISKYTSKKILKKDLVETGSISGYQSYKSREVVPHLTRALEKIGRETYGDCDVCRREIPLERLMLVPGALTCVPCDKNRK
jgi:RNA polymerase-binding transcription factor DksA